MRGAAGVSFATRHADRPRAIRPTPGLVSPPATGPPTRRRRERPCADPPAKRSAEPARPRRPATVGARNRAPRPGPGGRAGARGGHLPCTRRFAGRRSRRATSSTAPRRRAAGPLRGDRSSQPPARYGVDADGQTGPGRRLPDLPPDAPSRAVPPSRLRSPPVARLPAHAGLLPARVEPVSCARRGKGRRSLDRGLTVPLPPSIRSSHSDWTHPRRPGSKLQVTGIFLEGCLTDRSRAVGQGRYVVSV